MATCQCRGNTHVQARASSLYDGCVARPSSVPARPASASEESQPELVTSKRLPERYQVHELLGRASSSR
jgi:hypothetical protein